MSLPSRGAVTIDDVRRCTVGETVELSARITVRSDVPLPQFPDRVWVRVDQAAANAIDETPDPFIPPVWLVAARHHLDVHVPWGVSTRLSEGLSFVGKLYEAWSADASGGPYRAPTLHAAGVERVRRGTGAASFFSGGVDSMFTLVHNLRRYPRSDSRAIQGLVLLHGFDIPLADGARFDMTRAALEHSAKAVGIPLITVATNVRELYHGIDWLVFAHGPALMMVALSLAGGFHTMYVPSAHPFLDLIPLGTHPALDPHWSTEAIEVVHADGEFPRTVKIIRLAAQPDLLAGLRVCWSNVGTEYNCGRCEKCLRTMMTLGLNGLLPLASRFPPLNRTAFAAVRLSAGSHLFWQEIETWSAPGTDQELRAVLSEILARPLRVQTTARRESLMLRVLAKTSERVGHYPRKLAGALDDRLFGGRVRNALWAFHTRDRARARPR